ncbi:MAG TPA: hypothetical protein PLD14_01780 [Candidatus Pacearchaeota archaeon]|nr:hypothetical protein [Candidatus Pacearchaeota archaeon]HPR79929.1 hypothetical protein [Candidatus Pacearchaeota archaeon]
MEFQAVRDSENAIIGFDLRSNCYTEEDFFIRNLPGNLAKGLASIKVINDELVINNAREGIQSFKVWSDELGIINEYLESDDTMPGIDLGGFGLRAAFIRFENEPVRQKSIVGYKGPKENGGVVDNCA